MASIIRDRTPIASLDDPKRSIPVGEQDIRLDDYLNDKIQTLTDFDDLDALLANVDVQRIQLQDQLQNAKYELEKARDAVGTQTDLLLQQTQAFQIQQESIHKRLTIVGASDSPDDAVQKFKGPVEKLRRLELARAYIELLKEVDDLTEEARSHLPSDPKEALKPYSRLKHLSVSLRSLQGPAEEAGVHIVKYIEERTEMLWEEMKNIMSDEFQVVLKKNNWPSLTGTLDQEWSDSFEKLLDLQTPELLTARGPVILLPMAVMTKYFVQEFRYHFMSLRPTNSQSSPEIFFDWTISTISKWDDLICDNVGPVLAAHFMGSKLANNALYTDPTSAFITAFLPVVQEKVSSLLPVLSQDPSSLSNFIVLLMKFDDSLREEFGYMGGDPDNGWKGLTWDVLDVWFDRWLQVEKDFALERYQDIMSSKTNGRIDYDSAGVGKTKATFGVLKVTDLLASITKQYEPVRKFSRKLRFLIDVQLAILDQYHNRLKESLDVYIARTSTVGRTLHGVTKEQQAELEGTGGLESLCKVYGSSEHVITTLYDWADEMFFVELWNELQRRADKPDINTSLPGTTSYADMKNSVSVAAGSDSDDHGGLFDETISAFRGRSRHAEQLMVDNLKHSLPVIFRQYTHKAQWLMVDEGSGAVINPLQLNITAELDQPIQTLSINMAFLSRALSTTVFRRIWHPVLAALQDLLWAEVLMRERFTMLGAAQFMRDLLAIWGIIDKYIADGSSASFGMQKLKEGVQLLNLPTVSTDGMMALTDAYDRVFLDNTEAKLVINNLGFETLNYIEARQVLQRRVEATTDD